MRQPDVWRRSRRGTSGVTPGRAACALLVALLLWLGSDHPLQMASRCELLPNVALAEDDPAVETCVYQYTDGQGVVHFVDTLEKVPSLYRSQLIVRRDTAPPSPRTTAVLVVDNQILVPVILKHGHKKLQAQFILDTGSALTCVTEDFAARLGLDPTTMRAVRMGLADGSIIEFRAAQIDELIVGERSKSNMEVGILPNSGVSELHDGLLGLDFFKDFRYQIDVGQGVIRWQ